jgi:Arc/MetJ family transcription regulator
MARVAPVGKTTVHIADDLLAAAKERAARDHTTFRDVLESALRDFLAGTPRRPFRLRDASVGGQGLSPELAGRSFRDILDASYEGRGT